jgi:hypothetical protein
MPVSTPAHWAPTYLCGICGRPAGGLSEPDPVPPSAAQDSRNTDDNVRCFGRLVTRWRMLIQVWGQGPYLSGACFSTHMSGEN